jgi:tRNA (cytidine56-2'-O)-methyltransferase
MSIEDRSPKIEVLRIGHRPDRDKRITTHVALVSRAFGSHGIIIDTKDDKLEETVRSVRERFGGRFQIRSGVNRKNIMNSWKGTIVHLTMYGTPIDKVKDEIPRDEDLLIIVGAEKVPPDVYDNSHFNISVANQPHSEVSALAIFLDRYYQGREFDLTFEGGEVEIHPMNKGKLVTSPGEDIKGSAFDPFSEKWDPIPGPDDCLRLLEALGTSRSVMDHVKEVHRLGLELVNASARSGKGIKVNMDLYEAGLLLHDIGRSRTHSIKHVTKGVEIAKRLGLDQGILSIIRSHIGAGVKGGEAVKLGLEEIDHIPVTIEEKLVCHCDNLVGSKRRRPLSVPVEKLKAKGADAAASRMISLHEELEGLLGIDIDGHIQ